jgi:hypothetical protein
VPEQVAQTINTKVAFRGKVKGVSSIVVAANPEAGSKTTEFTRIDSEKVPDKVSRSGQTPKRDS